MIRDTVLVCCIVICCVLFYRMYILNQKINNLEEKTSVLDNFSQSIFQFITQKEEARLKQEEEREQQQLLQSANMNQPQVVKEVVYSNNQPLTPIVEEETETEDNHYNVNNNSSGEKISETFESKEILSEMVDELKESVINSTNESLKNDLDQINELKQELSNKNNSEDGLYNLLSAVDTNSENQEVKILDVHIENKEELLGKKKEEELLKMSMTEIKALAKIKNIALVKANKLKKKETLIQEILEQ
jgi:hypothetical protein